MMIKGLHPEPSGSNKLPSLPEGAPIIVVAADGELVAHIRHLASGAAPGASGWTTEMLLILASDPDCLKGIAQIIQDITNDHLPHSLKPYVLPSTLVALDKNNGAGIRPIAVG